jgi:uncharacterized membrane protein
MRRSSVEGSVKLYVVAYAAALVTIAILDGLWLGVVARGFYKSRIGPLMLDQPLWLPATVFYLVHAIGLVVFAAFPALASDSWTAAAWRGALFGLCAYAAYDLTNLATLRGWSATLSVVDIGWGIFASAAAATVAFLTTRASQ